MKQTAVEFLMDKLFDPSTMVQEQIEWFEQAKEMEKEQMIDWYATGQADTVNMYEQHLKKTSNTNEMTREEKLETIVKLFAKSMFYGDWKWETPNERVITMLMQEVGMYPFKDEDEMISQTQVSDELYKQAIKEITSRRAKGWDESITFNTNEE